MHLHMQIHKASAARQCSLVWPTSLRQEQALGNVLEGWLSSAWLLVLPKPGVACYAEKGSQTSSDKVWLDSFLSFLLPSQVVSGPSVLWCCWCSLIATPDVFFGLKKHLWCSGTLSISAVGGENNSSSHSFPHSYAPFRAALCPVGEKGRLPILCPPSSFLGLKAARGGSFLLLVFKTNMSALPVTESLLCVQFSCKWIAGLLPPLAMGLEERKG